MKLTKADRRQAVAMLLILTPVFTSVAMVLAGSVDWRTALAKLMVDLPVSAIGVFMRPPKVEGDTDDLPVVIAEEHKP